MKNRIKLTLIAASLSLLLACSQTQVSQQSQVAIPEQFEQLPEQAIPQNIQQWWQNWHDPVLNQLITQALQQNLDIASAQARLQEAQAISQTAEAALGPNVGLNTQGTIGGTNLNTGVINPASQQLYGLMGGISASWELDFFGQKQSDLEAAKYQALGYQQQLYATQLLITGQVAQHYFAISALEQQQKTMQQQIQTLNQLQQYLQARFKAGEINAYDQQDIGKQISALQAKESTLNAQRSLHQRNIAVLLGQPPQGFKLNVSTKALAKPPLPPTGQTPSTVLARRPDIMAHMAQVNAASAKLASAKADLYPRFDLNFMGQGGRIELDNDLSYLSGVSSFISLGIQLPLFTNGRIQANIEVADARLKNALIQYDKTLLTALAEVDNGYQMQKSLQKQTALLQQAVTQAQSQAHMASKLYQYGDKTLDSLLLAQLSLFDYQLQFIDAQLNQANNLIRLYNALGGGWQAL